MFDSFKPGSTEKTSTWNCIYTREISVLISDSFAHNGGVFVGCHKGGNWMFIYDRILSPFLSHSTLFFFSWKSWFPLLGLLASGFAFRLRPEANANGHHKVDFWFTMLKRDMLLSIDQPDINPVQPKHTYTHTYIPQCSISALGWF